MKRMTDAEIRKLHRSGLIFSVVSLMFGLCLLIFAPLSARIFPDIEYEELELRNIVIDLAHRINISKGSDSYMIIDTEGNEYKVSRGDIPFDVFDEKLSKGTEIEIRYYRSMPFGFLIAREVSAGGETLYPYANYTEKDIHNNTLIGVILGPIFLAFGILAFLVDRYFVKHDIKLQRDRDRRIIKKYGSLKKK